MFTVFGLSYQCFAFYTLLLLWPLTVIVFKRREREKKEGRERKERRGSQRVVANESAHSTHSQLCLVELIVSRGRQWGEGEVQPTKCIIIY